MSDKILTFEERRKLSGILSGLYTFTDEGAGGIRIFLQQAGLERFVSGMNLGRPARTVAADLIGRIEPFGELVERPNYHALGALLSAMLDVDDLPRDNAQFVAGLIVRYTLVNDPDTIQSIREQYDISEAAASRPEPEPSRSASQPAPPQTDQGAEATLSQAVFFRPSNVSLVQYLSDKFNREGLTNLSAEVGTDPEDLGASGKSALARELVKFARRRGRTDRLLAAAVQLNTTFEAHGYLHVLIADTFDAQGLAALCQSLALDCGALGLDANGLRGYDFDRFIKEQRATALHEAMAESGRFRQLLEAMGRAKPGLVLSAFEPVALPEQPAERVAKPVRRAELVEPPKLAVAKPARPTVQDFDVRVGAQSDGRYPVEVQRSPVGEMDTPEWRDSPLADADFDRLFGSLRNLSLDADGLEELGARLYAFLFAGKAGRMLGSSLDRAKEREEVLRIRLRIDPPELSRLPWEYCYHETEEFFALNPQTPVVRYSAQSFKARGLAAPEPVRILVAMASPEGMPALDVEAEKENIRQALEPLGDKVKLAYLPKTSIESLKDALALDEGYHILHFIGHGVFRRANREGALVLEGEDGQLQPLNATGLRRLLRSRGVRLVILNACDTAAHEATDALMGVAPSLARAEVPAVVAMQFKVPDTTAALFSRELYKYLADGDPLDVAITEMRLAASLTNLDRADWGTPVLYMRAPDGIIWN